MGGARPERERVVGLEKPPEGLERRHCLQMDRNLLGIRRRRPAVNDLDVQAGQMRPRGSGFDLLIGHAPPPGYAAAGRCARRKERIWRTASGILSFGSFHGNMLTSALGASIALSMATA